MTTLPATPVRSAAHELAAQRPGVLAGRCAGCGPATATGWVVAFERLPGRAVRGSVAGGLAGVVLVVRARRARSRAGRRGAGPGGGGQCGHAGRLWPDRRACRPLRGRGAAAGPAGPGYRGDRPCGLAAAAHGDGGALRAGGGDGHAPRAPGATARPAATELVPRRQAQRGACGGRTPRPQCVRWRALALHGAPAQPARQRQPPWL